MHFNPHSPRGERQFRVLFERPSRLFQSTLPARGATLSFLQYRQTQLISIHTPREGSDTWYVLSSAGRRISIHTPREGSDQPFSQKLCWNKNFNPHSPRGERLNVEIRFR